MFEPTPTWPNLTFGKNVHVSKLKGLRSPAAVIFLGYMYNYGHVIYNM